MELNINDCISRQAAINAMYNLHAQGKKGVEYDLKHTSSGVEYCFVETIKDAVEELEQLPSVFLPKVDRDAVSREAAIYAIRRIGMCKCSTNEIEAIDECRRAVEALPFFTAEPKAEQEPKTGKCEKCKHFRKLPYHADTLGKCIHHTGFCPKGDWYCADYEPQERSDKE